MDTNVDPARSGSWRKHLLWIIPAALAVLIVSGWYGVTYAAEKAARRCFAEASCQLFGREVEPQEVSYSLAGQELRISGIRVGNLPGYSPTRPAVEAEHIVAHVAPHELLFKRVIRLEELTFIGLNINAEVKMSLVWSKQVVDARINLFELKKSGSVARRPKEPLRFRIDELRVESGKVALTNLEDFRKSVSRYCSLPKRWTARSLDGYAQKGLGVEIPLTADEVAAEILNREWNTIRLAFEEIKRGFARKLEEISRKSLDDLNRFFGICRRYFNVSLESLDTIKVEVGKKIDAVVDSMSAEMKKLLDGRTAGPGRAPAPAPGENK